jgi:hypothetical protein
LKEVIECDGFWEALVWSLTLPFPAISCSSFYTFCHYFELLLMIGDKLDF